MSVAKGPSPFEIATRDLPPAARANQGDDRITAWCPTCRERAVPMRNGTCAFCETLIEPPPPTLTVNGSDHTPPVIETPTGGEPDEAALRLGDDLLLPLDAATQSLAILAVKGAGKSNAAAVLAEELFDEGIPWVVIDPKGDWWGIRETVGESRGLPVLVLGGPHGDLELSPYSGRQIASLIVERSLTCVLDVSWMDDEERPQFLADFGQALFDLHHHSPSVRHLIVEEANEVLPQTGGTREMRRAWTRIVCQGRQRGLGITLVSQRSALVNKNVLTQTGSLIVLRTTSPQDRAVIRGWVDFHSVSKELVDSLPGLANGEAWIVAPSWLGRVERVKLRRRWTFDSGATPEVLSTRQAQTLDSVDVEEIRGLLYGGDEPPEPEALAADEEPEMTSDERERIVLERLAQGSAKRAELQQLADLTPWGFQRFMTALRDRRVVRLEGVGPGSRWMLTDETEPDEATEADPPPSTLTGAALARQLVHAHSDAEDALEQLDEILSQPQDSLTLLRARYLAALLARIEAGEMNEALLDRFERVAGMADQAALCP